MNKVYLDLVNKSKKIALLGPFINNVKFEKTKLDIVEYYTNYMPVYNKLSIVPEEKNWQNYIKLSHQLIYFKKPESIYNNIEKLLDLIPKSEEMINKYSKEIKYLEEIIGSAWYVVELLKRGIGIHHGKTPMFLRKFYENEYNNGNLRILLCTNTLMEGINTPTDSLIVVDDPGSAFKLNNLMRRVGILMIANADALFDKHLITISDDREIIFSYLLKNEFKLIQELKLTEKVFKAILNNKRKEYLKRHREVFEKKEVKRKLCSNLGEDSAE